MDVLTHGFAPLGVCTWLRRPRAERIAAAVGGMSPDVDTLWAWTSAFDGHLYPLAHRGFSHTVWGAPALAVLVWFLLTRPFVGSKWTRLGRLEWSRPAVVALVLGATSHLVLDMVTITGVPLVWPISGARVGPGWFFYSVPLMLLVSLLGWIRVLRRRGGERGVRLVTTTLLVVLLLSGALRAFSHPRDMPEGAKATTLPLEWQWIVSHRNETGVLVWATSWAQERPALFMPESNRTEARPAREACESDVGFRAWRWNVWGLPVVDAQGDGEAGWLLTYRDSARYHQSLGGSVPFGRGGYEGLACHVTADGQVRIDRPASFWGS